MKKATIYFKDQDKEAEEIKYTKWSFNPEHFGHFGIQMPSIGFIYQNSATIYDLSEISHIELEDGSLIKYQCNPDDPHLEITKTKDVRTGEQKKKAKETAYSLRVLADIVEKSIVQDYRIEGINDHVEHEIDTWIHQYPNGGQSFTIGLSIYNPDMDRRSDYIEDLKKSDLT